jgi:hypothetical protein
MKERPILFSGRLVRAILEGRKTQTRRVIRPQIEPFEEGPLVHARKHPKAYLDMYRSDKDPSGGRDIGTHWCWWTSDDRQGPGWYRCPFGQPGDQLWVRENFWRDKKGEYIAYAATPEVCNDDSGQVWSLPDTEETPTPEKLRAAGYKLCPSIHMPRDRSRIQLEVTGVRVERLQEISEEDARAEGIPPMLELAGDIVRDIGLCRPAFRNGWDHLNAKRGFGWLKNPWVWVIEFRRIKP